MERLWSGVNNFDMFDEPDARLDEMLEQLAQADLRVVRIGVDLRLEMDENGIALPQGQYNDCILDQIDNLMLRAKRKGVLLLITLQFYNWIQGDGLKISKDFYEWRNCKTPVEVYRKALRDGEQEIHDPYYQRGWGADYVTNSRAKQAYKDRVHHILHHVNPHFGKPWKEIEDVVWAWELHGEVDLLDSRPEPRESWLREMAAYIKRIDPATYIALGTASLIFANIPDADIYTIHPYGFDVDGLGDTIQRFQREIGGPYGKLLLVEEFNPLFEESAAGVQRRVHTPDRKSEFESIMEECRRNKTPWMFWEYGYWFDGDDIWHANKVYEEDQRAKAWPDGILWGGKVLPGAKRIWNTPWAPAERTWKVHEMVGALCTQPGADCDHLGLAFFIDTFSSPHLDPDYTWINAPSPGVTDTDSYSLTDERGYLRITAGIGQDLWAGPSAKTGAPLMLRDAPPADYTIETFVRADDPGEEVLDVPLPYPVQPLNSQMGLFVYQNVNNWLFFGLTYHDFTIEGTRVHGDGLIVTRTEHGESSNLKEYRILADFMFLRIRRRGDDWKCYWKTEHVHRWKLLTTVRNLVLADDHKVGMGVKTLDLFPDLFGPAKAYFDFFMISR